MADPFVGEIRMFAGTFAPRDWAFCDGQLLAISQNDALFSLLGTYYGGDGRTTFGLPDLRGRLPVHQGSGPGLSPRNMGTRSGAESVTLTADELPGHLHLMQASTATASSPNPAGQVTAVDQGANLYSTTAPTEHLAAGAVSQTGGSQPHDNLMPYSCVHFIIALNGIYPSRS